MELTNNIYDKLSAARSLIRHSKTKKEGRNTYSAYDYFTPEQVEGLVADACEAVKAICITSLKKDELGYFQVLDFVDLENPSGERIHFELRTERPEIKATNLTQQMGGMDTYSERYIKMKVFQIKDNNLDFDAQDNRQTPAASVSQKVLTAQGQKVHATAIAKKVERQERRDDAEHDVVSQEYPAEWDN